MYSSENLKNRWKDYLSDIDNFFNFVVYDLNPDEIHRLVTYYPLRNSVNHKKINSALLSNIFQEKTQKAIKKNKFELNSEIAKLTEFKFEFVDDCKGWLEDKFIEEVMQSIKVKNPAKEITVKNVKAKN